MAGQNADGLKRFYNAADLSLTPSNATTGVWASQLSSNIYTFHKAAAATTSVVNIAVPKSFRGFTQEDFAVSVITVFYGVTTADLTSAPTAVLNLLTNPSTGFTARSAVTQTLTFGGIDAIGKVSGAGAAGSHTAIVTITTPAQLAETDSLVLAMTMGEAATSVLDINGILVAYV